MITYEVVWCDCEYEETNEAKQIMYVWEFQVEKDVEIATDLPEEVSKVCEIIRKHNKDIPFMVYRFGDENSYCSHSNADNNKKAFGDGKNWLKFVTTL